MRFKIDAFYKDSKLGHLKFKGWQEGNLVFDNYVNAYGKISQQRATFHPVLQKSRMDKLKPCQPIA